eukprot:comp12124_c0_seq1/m.6860 comp12124_c0_seq1/g.6860  ORF comp12124_c0_seq1/g.6860 comp12124_c0_seq1/m.6860 type:complete len:125 (-) comp12124_c0_seq1:619-993(-)
MPPRSEAMSLVLLTGPKPSPTVSGGLDHHSHHQQIIVQPQRVSLHTTKCTADTQAPTRPNNASQVASFSSTQQAAVCVKEKSRRLIVDWENDWEVYGRDIDYYVLAPCGPASRTSEDWALEWER